MFGITKSGPIVWSNLTILPELESLVLINCLSSRIHLMVGIGCPLALHLIVTVDPNLASTSAEKKI